MHKAHKNCKSHSLFAHLIRLSPSKCLQLIISRIFKVVHGGLVPRIYIKAVRNTNIYSLSNLFYFVLLKFRGLFNTFPVFYILFLFLFFSDQMKYCFLFCFSLFDHSFKFKRPLPRAQTKQKQNKKKETKCSFEKKELL